MFDIVEIHVSRDLGQEELVVVRCGADPGGCGMIVLIGPVFVPSLAVPHKSR